MLKGWQDVFGTSDKREVEEDLRNSQLDFAWKKKDGLRIVNREAAVETHPETGDKVWFNHVQVRAYVQWSKVQRSKYIHLVLKCCINNEADVIFTQRRLHFRSPCVIRLASFPVLTPQLLSLAVSTIYSYYWYCKHQ